jgi:hypothetical protein
MEVVEDEGDVVRRVVVVEEEGEEGFLRPREF